MLGDSTSIFALPSLAAEGFDANARGCRQFPEAIALLGRLRHAHALPHLVVIALGANGPVTDAYVRQVLTVLGRSRQLVLVTTLQAGGRPAPGAATVRAEARVHPDQVHMLDWITYSAGHSSWFQPDRLHLTYTGARAFARLLGQALPLAPPPGPATAPATHPTRPPPVTSAPDGELDLPNPPVILVSVRSGGGGGGGRGGGGREGRGGGRGGRGGRGGLRGGRRGQSLTRSSRAAIPPRRSGRARSPAG